MPTQEEINNAYNLIYNEEKRLTTELLEKLDAFKDYINYINGAIPSQASGSILKNFLNQVNMAHDGFKFSYDNLKNTYGLNANTTTPLAYVDSANNTESNTVALSSDTGQV